jgi:dTMP kinase
MSAKDSRQLPGKLIAVEGIDGSGKSTQIYLLRRWLELDGYKVEKILAASVIESPNDK